MSTGLRTFVLFVFSSQGAHRTAVTLRRLLRAVLVGLGHGVRHVIDFVTIVNYFLNRTAAVGEVFFVLFVRSPASSVSLSSIIRNYLYGHCCVPNTSIKQCSAIRFASIGQNVSVVVTPTSASPPPAQKACPL